MEFKQKDNESEHSLGAINRYRHELGDLFLRMDDKNYIIPTPAFIGEAKINLI